jgi:hypothetical protein
MAKWYVRTTKGTASVQGVGALQAAAASPSRARILTLELGFIDTPGDTTQEWIVQRATTVPTGSSKTPNARDAADALAANVQATDTITVDGTYTAGAFQLEWGTNQRQSVRWVAFSESDEIIIPATANNGVVVGLQTATVLKAGAGIAFDN